jgi:hypothetical protein
MRRPILTGSKSFTVKAFAMTQQTEMFIRLVGLGGIPMSRNANGLFIVDQVAVLASKRGCLIHKAGDYSIEIKHPGKLKGQFTNASIMATDKGLWHPVAIFRACREAAGQPHHEIDYAKAKIKNPGNLDEVLIAEIIGADGVRAYLSRPGQYRFDELGIHRPPNVVDLRDLRNAFGHLMFDDLPRGEVGSWTWPMLNIVSVSHVNYGRQPYNPGKSHHYRRAIRALDDAGLLKLTVGARGSFGTATFEWLPAAYLAVEAPKLDHADSEYLTDLMALSG